MCGIDWDCVTNIYWLTNINRLPAPSSSFFLSSLLTHKIKISTLTTSNSFVPVQGSNSPNHPCTSELNPNPPEANCRCYYRSTLHSACARLGPRPGTGNTTPNMTLWASRPQFMSYWSICCRTRHKDTSSQVGCMNWHWFTNGYKSDGICRWTDMQWD